MLPRSRSFTQIQQSISRVFWISRRIIPVLRNTLRLLRIQYLFQVYVNVCISLSHIPLLATTYVERKLCEPSWELLLVFSEYPLFTLYHGYVFLLLLQHCRCFSKKTRPELTTRIKINRGTSQKHELPIKLDVCTNTMSQSPFYRENYRFVVFVCSHRVTTCRILSRTY